ncbi:hypothetical protein QAD02_000847 [Eretmocerus hayati]|uniref:Uncharacterized protein n=1 Tax=Eretmocerus hayati TaxID=131215 RepID=A0ACC2NFM5_9HYME|nr:hypothetical protein QAD02_000847 [Eretmocerus hayati]
MDDELLNSDEVWETLGEELGRNPQEVREAFEVWSRAQPSTSSVVIDSDFLASLTDPDSFKEEQESASEPAASESDVLAEADRIILQAQVQAGLSSEVGDHQPQLLDVHRPLSELNTSEYNTRELAYEFFEGSSNDQFTNLITKRQRETEKFHEEALDSFRNQSIQELELKRIEHEKKMELYDKQLRNGEEVHREKMKILKNKLEFTERQLRHIENVISDRNHRKRLRTSSD